MARYTESRFCIGMSADMEVTITSLVDRITIQRIVARCLSFTKCHLWCAFPKLYSSKEREYYCEYHLSCDKTLALNGSFSVNCGMVERLHRVSIITDKGSSDYFY
ncbi:hypothetical protein [Helicobacter rodentium]|uniref:hypothetical protein n=1 Tax=Helicobacter rodentium TaxID=59617 RepID=UPI0025A5E717|nr:hypothetical protein [Helicobacter rodentium]